MNTGELILYSFPDPVHAAAADHIFAELGIRGRAVSPDEVTQTVGCLAGMPGQEAAPRPLVLPRLAEPVMILCGISRPRMDELFTAMRSGGCPPPDRKAILTPTNLGWSLVALYEELGREHEEMHGRKPN
jgi:hypothetical protein